MEKLMELIKRKSQIEYDINSVEKYIKGGDFDGSLKRTFDIYQDELVEIKSQIELLSNPKTKDILLEKLEMVGEIERKERELDLLKAQLKELENRIKTVM